MKFYISVELDLEEFTPWGGAVSRLEEIKELEIVEEAQEFIEEMLSGLEVVTLSDVNDLLWFDMDDFIQDYKEGEDEEE